MTLSTKEETAIAAVRRRGPITLTELLAEIGMTEAEWSVGYQLVNRLEQNGFFFVGRDERIRLTALARLESEKAQ
jgi:hypothetical protein